MCQIIAATDDSATTRPRRTRAIGSSSGWETEKPCSDTSMTRRPLCFVHARASGSVVVDAGVMHERADRARLPISRSTALRRRAVGESDERDRFGRTAVRIGSFRPPVAARSMPRFACAIDRAGPRARELAADRGRRYRRCRRR